MLRQQILTSKYELHTQIINHNKNETKKKTNSKCEIIPEATNL